MTPQSHLSRKSVDTFLLLHIYTYSVDQCTVNFRLTPSPRQWNAFRPTRFGCQPSYGCRHLCFCSLSIGQFPFVSSVIVFGSPVVSLPLTFSSETTASIGQKRIRLVNCASAILAISFVDLLLPFCIVFRPPFQSLVRFNSRIRLWYQQEIS